MRALIAVPVRNEADSIPALLPRITALGHDILCVDDASTDDTPARLRDHPVEVLRHPTNRGYGGALLSAFRYAADRRYDWLVTMDCDRQHDPAWTPGFLADAATDRYDLISGSRYLNAPPQDALVPADRRYVNATLTAEINRLLGLRITDAFCGFKAHRVATLADLRLTETGYAFPMQLWPRAAALGLRIHERPVDLIYVDLTRTFGSGLDDHTQRLAHYRRVLHDTIAEHR